MGKVLAIDYGERKTGIAISDELRIVATELPVIFTDKSEILIRKILELVIKNAIEIIVIGVPSSYDGKDSKQGDDIRSFITALEADLYKVAFPTAPKVVTWDESFTSAMSERGKTRKYRQKKADSVAAKILLQEFLDSVDQPD